MAKAASAKVMKAAREHLSKMVGRFGQFSESPGVRALVRVEAVNLEKLEITLHCISPVPKSFGDDPWQMGYVGPDMDARFTIDADPTSVSEDFWRNYMCFVTLLEAGRGEAQHGELTDALYEEAAREYYQRFINPDTDGLLDGRDPDVETREARDERIAAEATKENPVYAAFECGPERGTPYRTRRFFWLPCAPPPPAEE